MTNLLRKTKIEGTVGKKEKIPKTMEERKKKNGKMKKKVKGKKEKNYDRIFIFLH